MSISEGRSQVDPSIKKLYLATCEGKFCAPVETISSLEVLVKKGYIEVTKCPSDPRSKHGAKTCKVKLAWLTDRGKEAAKKATERFDEPLKELNLLLENTNPRISVLAKYLLARWSASILAYKDDVAKRRPRYRGGWNMLPSFEWDIKVPGTFGSMLPEGVKNELRVISKKLVQLELAERNKLGHNVHGWYDSETLMTIKPIARAILKHYGGFEIPSFIKSLVLSISKAAQERELARDLEAGKISIESIVDYLNYGSFHELSEFLKTLETLNYSLYEGYAHVNWSLIEKYAKPGIPYAVANRDEMAIESIARSIAVSRRTYGVMPSIYAITSLRHSLVFEAVKKALATWFDTGTLCLEEIPPFRTFWNVAELEEIKRIRPYLEKLASFTIK